MNFFLIIAVAFALAMDAFAVSVGISVNKEVTKKQTLRLALYFGLFQFMMPILGWYVAQNVLIKYVEPFDHWVAFCLLLIIGGKMIYESFKRGEKPEKSKADPTKGLSLIMLSVATSIDALAVGLSLAALQVARDCSFFDDNCRCKNWPFIRAIYWQKSRAFRRFDSYPDWNKNSLRSLIKKFEKVNSLEN